MFELLVPEDFYFDIQQLTLLIRKEFLKIDQSMKMILKRQKPQLKRERFGLSGNNSVKSTSTSSWIWLTAGLLSNRPV